MEPPVQPAPPPGNRPGFHSRQAGLNVDGLLALVNGIGIMMVILDLAVATGWSGIFGVVGMLPILFVLVRKQLGRRSLRIRRLLRAMFGVDAVVALTLLAMLVTRTYILGEQIDAEDPSQYTRAARLYTLIFAVVAILSHLSVSMPERLARMLLSMVRRPALLLAGSFAGLVVVMSLLLTLPPAVERVSDVSFVNALFMVTSAVCVTGLTVVDPAPTYTLFGEIVIFLSIQLGGIGIMTVAALSISFARDSALATQLRYAKLLGAQTLSDLRAIVGAIVVGTLALEAIGAVILWFAFEGDPRIGDASAGWLAVFHAVSAFCNAGFSLLPGGMALYATHAGVQAVIVVLVIAGGIGFPVLRELFSRALDWVDWIVEPGARRPAPLSLATRVVLVTSGLLLLAGAILLGALEYGRGSMQHLGAGERLLAGLFMSVNARTAGFNTIDIGALGATSLVVTCVLMFIGGSPGSTAGGIKTTTFATIFATMRAELRNREPRLGKRAIASDVVRKAIAVAALSATFVVVGLLALTLTERQPFDRLLFETVSAFATVGLSTGITPELTVPGKLIVSALMFVGRVGPLTIALAVGSTAGALRYRLARESLPIG